MTQPPITPAPEDVRLRARRLREAYEAVYASLEALAHAHTPERAYEVYTRLHEECGTLVSELRELQIEFALNLPDPPTIIHIEEEHVTPAQ